MDASGGLPNGSGIGGELTDEELDKLIEAMQKMRKPEDDNKTFEEHLAELDNHPAFMKEWDPSKPISEEMEGLIRLQYECEDPVGRAEAYKEDGNYEFKKKQYQISVLNYTEGIKCKCPDKLLNAILYTNRAAAQYHLENYRSAFLDCIFAKKFKQGHFKAVHRGAMCCLQMKKYDECIAWCDEALTLEPKNASIQDMRQKATNLLKSVERDKRKELKQEKTELSKELKLLEVIQSRGIKLAGIKKTSLDCKDLNPTLLTNLETHNPHGAKVNVDSNGVMYWPVMFLYPEHTETDYIQMFCENHRFIDHLSHMFSLEMDPPPWDPDRKYKPHTINVFYENKETETLHKVKKETTLIKVLQQENYVVFGGTPSFILTVAGSTFEKSFLEKYKL